MRWLVLLLSLAMPVVSWFSQQGVFGPTNGAISDRYPTLIVAAGYAFAIWGLIFLWDMVFGAWQASGIDGSDSITPEMREDIVYECFDVIQSCVNLLESIGTTDAELRDAARKVYANNVERGRYEPY